MKDGLIRVFLTASGARALTAVLMALRVKIVAVALGPEGVGLLGLLTATQEIGAQAADCGLSHSGTRALARERDSPRAAARVQRAWALGATGLATLGAIFLFLLAAPMSVALIGDGSLAWQLRVVSAGLALTVLARWRHGVVAAAGRADALSIAMVASAVLAAAATLVSIALLGSAGLALAVIALPATMLLALCPVRLPRTGRAEPSAVLPTLGALLRGGLGLMWIAQMALILPMALRIGLLAEADLATAGLFQAAWTVWAQAMAVLLSVIALDFYPRISRLTADPAQAAAAVQRQTGVLLSLGTPPLLAGIALAEPVLLALFDTAFGAAAPLLQCLLGAGILRLAAAPAECALTAAGRTGRVIAAGLATLTVTLGLAWLLWPALGLTGIGLACIAGQALQLALLVFAHSHGSSAGPGARNAALLAGSVAAACLAAMLPLAAGLAIAGVAGLLAARGAGVSALGDGPAAPGGAPPPAGTG